MFFSTLKFCGIIFYILNLLSTLNEIASSCESASDFSDNNENCLSNSDKLYKIDKKSNLWRYSINGDTQ